MTRRTEFLLNPPANAKRGDAGIYAWEAFANLLAAELFDQQFHETAARTFLERVRSQLDDRWESFNCAAEGDLVGCGQGRPFGHAVALAAARLAADRFKQPAWLDVAEQCGNITLGLYYSTANGSPTPDMDTRGWAVGATGGRDQLCHMPPWETAFALQQLAWLLDTDRSRNGFYDVLWMFARTGLCMFPKARTMKRLYTTEFAPVYRPIDSLPTEREFYLKLPYLAYEEPWDQTMLAGYQGVEPIVLSLYLGGGLVQADDPRILALVPAAARFDPTVNNAFDVHLWNPTATTIETALTATVAERQQTVWRADNSPELTPDQPVTAPTRVPPRKIVIVRLTRP